jgi:hypothetical protein
MNPDSCERIVGRVLLLSGYDGGYVALPTTLSKLCRGSTRPALQRKARNDALVDILGLPVGYFSDVLPCVIMAEQSRK